MKDARQAAQGLASLGRGEDSVLVHMTPGEVQGLQSLAMAHGGSLTINPETGLAEAGFLKSLLPTIVGAALAGITGGWAIPMLAGAATGAVTGDKDQSLLMRAGLGALGGVGGANIYGGLAGIASTGAGAVGAGTIPGASSFTPLVEGAGQAAAKEGVKAGALETMKQGAANLVKEGGFKAFTQAMPLGKFGLAAAAAPTIANMMQPPEYDVPESGSTKPKFYVGKDGQPLWRPGTYNPETGVFEGQGWNEGEYVSPYPGMEDDENRGFAEGGYIRRFVDGGSTSTSTAPFNYTPEQLAQIQAAIGDVPNWGLTALTGGTGISGTTIGGGQIAPTTQSTAQSTIQPASTSVASVQPTALPTNFYSQIETAGPSEAWRWLRSNTQGLTLPTDWNTDEWTTAEKNRWLLANYPGIDPTKFETARDIYRSGRTTNTNTTFSTFTTFSSVFTTARQVFNKVHPVFAGYPCNRTIPCF